MKLKKCICGKFTGRVLPGLWAEGLHADFKPPGVALCSRACEIELARFIRASIKERKK